MRVFDAGATGSIDCAVVQDQLQGAHQALGLARPEACATSLTAGGAQTRCGILEDSESHRSGSAVDGAQRPVFTFW